MGIKFKITALIISLLVISGCSSNSSQPVDEADHSTMNKEEMEEMGSFHHGSRSFHHGSRPNRE